MSIPDELKESRSVLLWSKEMANRPKKAPNAFIIFKSKWDKSEIGGQGTFAKKQRKNGTIWVAEREVYTNEYEELRAKQARELERYNTFSGFQPKKKMLKRMLEAETEAEEFVVMEHRRGKGSKNKNTEETASADEDEPKTVMFKCKGVDL